MNMIQSGSDSPYRNTEPTSNMPYMPEHGSKIKYDTPLKSCYILNLVSALVMAVPTALGFVYVILIILLVVCTFFIGLSFVDTELVAMIFVIGLAMLFVNGGGMMLIILGYENTKKNLRSIMMVISPIYMIVEGVIWVIIAISLREKINAMTYIVILSGVTGIILAAISLVKRHLTLKVK